MAPSATPGSATGHLVSSLCTVHVNFILIKVLLTALDILEFCMHPAN